MSWDDDDIGYGRPPKWTRFEKGTSGNPNGRPRRAKSASEPAPGSSEHDDILRQTPSKTIDVSEGGGKRRKAKMAEIVQQQQVNAASKGNVHAQRDVLRAKRELEERDRLRAEAAAALEAKVFEYVIDWRRDQARIWSDAVARGVEPDKPWPHPDDMLINHDRGTWRIRGPSETSEVRIYAGMRADRDVAIVRSVLSLRKGKGSRSSCAFYGYVALEIDDMLPRRWQVRVDGWAAQAQSLLTLQIRYLRILLSSCEKHAASIGRPPLSKDSAREAYQFVDRVMRPCLRRMGYRSYKQFEKAYAEMGNKLPWPRVSGQGAISVQGEQLSD